jgi:hypothetical protein
MLGAVSGSVCAEFAAEGMNDSGLGFGLPVPTAIDLARCSSEAGILACLSAPGGAGRSLFVFIGPVFTSPDWSRMDSKPCSAP